MKLNIVPARTGFLWFKQGIQTFGKQPLALTGLFFMYMASASLLFLVPLIGSMLALAIVPAATLGFMAATQEAVKGKFPTPLLLLSAFRAGKAEMRSMMVLGFLYAACWVAIVLLAGVMVDLPAAPVDAKQVPPGLLMAMLLVVALYLPVSLAFWHAPALVHWHGVSPVKSLFFSVVACLRNWQAMMVYGLMWMALIFASGIAISLFAMMTGKPQISLAIAMPLSLLMTAMFSTSLYFTFRDSFVAAESPEPLPGDPT